MKVDFHTHSKASDGEFAPKDLVQIALNNKVTHLALTDHDCVLGIKEAKDACVDKDITLIPGIEVSTTWRNTSIHIVGLFIDEDHEAMQELSKLQFNTRLERAIKIGEKLSKAGFENAYERTKAQAQENAIITRGNYARFLFSTGQFRSIDDAFYKYLRRGARAYVHSQWMDIKDAVEFIKRANGVAVLAHPKRYKITNTKLRELIAYFKSVGGEAMEVSSTQQRPCEREYLGELCLKNDLYASCGSDFHILESWREVGRNLDLDEKLKPIWTHPKALKYFA